LIPEGLKRDKEPGHIFLKRAIWVIIEFWDKYFKENNKRDRSKYFKKYQKEHKEQLKKNAREWYIKNREIINE